MAISPDQQFQTAGHAISCALGEGTAILDSRKNRYFSLNAVGAFIWERIASLKTPDAIAREVSSAYGVGLAVSLPDVITLLDELLAEGLVIECMEHDRASLAEAS